MYISPPREDAFVKTDVVSLNINSPFGKLNIPLTELSEAELTVMKGMFDLAFNTALPICREIDRVAQEEFDAGLRDHSRMFRDRPVLWRRANDEDGELADDWEGPDPIEFTSVHAPRQGVVPASEVDEDTSYKDAPTND